MTNFLSANLQIVLIVTYRVTDEETLSLSYEIIYTAVTTTNFFSENV